MFSRVEVHFQEVSNGCCWKFNRIQHPNPVSNHLMKKNHIREKDNLFYTPIQVEKRPTRLIVRANKYGMLVLTQQLWN